MKSSETLVVRADASVAIGTGHVMRCLALAQAWQDSAGEVVFAMAESTAAIRERLRSERVEIVSLNSGAGGAQDAEQIGELAQARHASWVVVDGYGFDAEYQRSLKNAGLKLLFVDDNSHCAHYFADLVLNQNAHAGESLYASRENYTRLLLGPRYAMLRREFRPWRQWKREIAAVGCKVLVTMGGSDPNNITGRVIDALRLVEVAGLKTTIVVGGSNPHGERLEREAEVVGGAIQLLPNAFSMPELMADADVAISAAGTTCWELCFLGLPTLLIDVAANQTPVAEALDQQGVAIHLGGSDQVSAETIARELKLILSSEHARSEMSRHARELVDGSGTERVVSAMQAASLHLRRVEEADCRLLWEWANDQEVRSAAFCSTPIPWDHHLEWFTKKLGDPKTLLLIATDEQLVPIGQVRFEWTKSREADIDVSIARDKRGRGLGGGLIEKAVQNAFEETNLVRVHAFVKAENHASAKAFESADFRNVAITKVKGFAAIHYQRDRDDRK